MQPLNILYEDNHLLIVNKPGGLLVQGDRTGDTTLLDLAKAYIKDRYQKPGEVFLGLPHRLDRVTSGAVILSRTSKSLTRMTQIFKDRAIHKVYAGITHYEQNLPTKDSLEGYIFKDRQRNKSRIVSERQLKQFPQARKAKLDYKLLNHTHQWALYQIILYTGRPHQIRTQMSALGLPILGDLKYGSSQKLGKHIALHSWKLEFVHPVKKTLLQIEADLPNRFPWTEFELGGQG